MMLRPTFKKCTLDVYKATAQCPLKMQTAETGAEIQFPLTLAICTPNKVGREQLRIDFNITNAVISIEFST